MSRSGYNDEGDIDQWDLIRWRGAVTSAMRGKRGQQFFRDLLAALDAMPEKRLIAEELETREGNVCAIGALGKARGVPMQEIDPEDYGHVAKVFNIAEPLAQEVVYMNDEAGSGHRGDDGVWRDETPEQRFTRIRAWVAGKIKVAPTTETAPTPESAA